MKQLELFINRINVEIERKTIPEEAFLPSSSSSSGEGSEGGVSFVQNTFNLHRILKKSNYNIEKALEHWKQWVIWRYGEYIVVFKCTVSKFIVYCIV